MSTPKHKSPITAKKVAKKATGKAAGGLARAAKLSPEERSESARKAALAKADARKLPKATHGSSDHPLKIGDVEIPCCVLNPLRAPSSAPTTVPMLFYFSGADDFEVAGPTEPLGIVFSPESGEGEIVVKSIGNSISRKMSDIHNANTHGDPIVSLKQLLNSARLYVCPSLSATSGAFFPNTHAIATYTTGVTINQSSTPGMDLVDYVCSGFAFKRGSIRVMAANEGVGSAMLVRDSSSTSFRTLAALGYTNVFNSTVPITNASFARGQLISPFVSSRQLDVTVPYHNATPISLCDFSGPSATSKPVQPDSSRSLLVYNFASASTQWSIPLAQRRRTAGISSISFQPIWQGYRKYSLMIS